MLSAGSAGRWYFEWFEDRYGRVDRHIGVEALAPRPDDLPPEVEWIQDTIGSLQPVGDGEVELVFAGQVIEHVQPIDPVDFLCESHRVLESEGRLVVDSPNSRALGWEHPGHVLELTVDEIVTMVRIAGFGEISVFGVWLCYDRDGHAFLALDPRGGSPIGLEDRVALAHERPEDSFVWWIEARRQKRPVDRVALMYEVSEAMIRDRVLRAVRRVSARLP